MFENALATNDFEQNVNLEYYPNPSNGSFNMKAPIDSDFEVYNQLGQAIQQIHLQGNALNTINLEHLSEGIYFLKGIKETHSTTYKLVLKK